MARASPARGVPRVLVIYATTEGHSAKVAAAFGDTLRGEGLQVEVANAVDAPPDPEAFDAAVVVASVHAGDYRGELVDWARRHARALNDRSTAFASVSLGVLQNDPKVRKDLEEIRGRFLQRTGWVPTLSTDVAGALMYSRYNLVKRLMMKRIAAQAGGDTDTERDYEYTDWKALQSFARKFAGRIGRGSAAAKRGAGDAARGRRA